MFQVAVYGKGGIGKSTMSANISVALSGMGLKVMQVGCDPKHDSTRLLLGGRTQLTVLDYVREVPIGRRKLDDVIEEGAAGVLCTEAGGPEPGIGCAGRGILTTFDTLKKLGADDLDVDVRLYDVLGDVVCGGFAVPLRSEYADAVILVTSGEFMSLYAANNILKGLGNFDDGRRRLLGVVLNSRGVEGELESVRRFAEAAGTRILAVIPRDRLFAQAEAQGHTVMELYPESAIADGIRGIAEAVVSASKDGTVLSEPRPLDDDQMSDLAAGREIRPPSEPVPRISCQCRTTIEGTRVMSSCAAYGAVAAYMRLDDTAVVIHGPVSCSFLMCTTHAKAVLDLYDRDLYAKGPRNNVRCTCMDDTAAIFGGNGFLRKCLEDTVGEGFRSIAVVTTCMSGIIGDDCASVIDDFATAHPDVRFSLIQTDGDIAGEYNDGFFMAADAIADSIDPDLEPDPSLVNLVGSSFFDIQTPAHADELDRMLGAFGLRVNCRFLDDGSPAPPSEICRAGTDILMNDTRNSRDMMSMISSRTGREPFPAVMPVGIREYLEWVDVMGRFTGKTHEAEREKDRAAEEYRGLVEEHRPRMEGTRAIIMWKMGANPDWLVDTLNDLGVEILRIGFAPSSRKAGYRPDSRYEVTENYTDDRLREDLEELRPDLLIGDLVKPVGEGTVFAKLSRIGVGYRSVFEYIRYLENSLRLPAVEGWREGRP